MFNTTIARSKFAAFAAGTSMMLLSILIGAAIGSSWRAVTPFGLFLFGRLHLQLWFAHLNNRYWRRVIRGRYLKEANKLDRRVPTRRITGKHYLKWREELWDRHPRAEDNWNAIVKAALENAARERAERLDRPYTGLPKVGIEIPIHGLTETEVAASVQAILTQNYPNIGPIVLAFNDPANAPLRQGLLRLMRELEQLDDRIILLDLPFGRKRGAMAEGYRIHIREGCDLSFNFDGDTTPDPDAVSNTVLAMLVQPKASGVTSNVMLRNENTNSLTKATAQRYFQANNWERAAQSWFFAVTCMSGPCMAIWTSAIEEMLEHPDWWEHQTFAGEEVGPGDDRQATTVLNELGLGTVYVPDVVVWTDCPENIEDWLKQQLRWIRSALRTFFITMNRRWYSHVSLWSVMDHWYLAIGSFLLVFVVLSVLGWATYDSIMFGPEVAIRRLLTYIVIVTAANSLKTVYAMIAARSLKYWRTFTYLYYQVRYLTWLRFVGIVTMGNQKWLTRDQKGSVEP